MNMSERITNYICAGYPGIYIVSTEEVRVQGMLSKICNKLKYNYYVWSITRGVMDAKKGTVLQDELEPNDAINWFSSKGSDKSLLLLRDFHMFLDVEEPDPVLVRTMREQMMEFKDRNKVCVVIGCKQKLPPEIEKDFAVIEFSLPDEMEIDEVLQNVAKSNEISLSKKEREEVVDSAMGLTSVEAENAFALSLVQGGKFDPEIIYREKSQIVKKSGLLEIVEQKETLDHVGGLDLAKEWIIKRRNAHTHKAAEFSLPTPKGILVLGVPGTGKSLLSKSVASVLNRPLLRLDVARLFGSLVGQTEQNWRAAAAVAEAISPCVLWIDEVEKGLSGTKSSNVTDGGTSSRVFGSIITWLQEKTKPVFVVATANDISQLPPELLRPGRFDALFFVDLPNDLERAEIWDIQIKKYNRNPADFNIQKLVERSVNMTGAEVEQALIEGLYSAFEENREVLEKDITSALKSMIPLSKTMAESIKKMQEWAADRAKPASTKIANKKHESGGRKVTTISNVRKM